MFADQVKHIISHFTLRKPIKSNIMVMYHSVDKQNKDKRYVINKDAFEEHLDFFCHLRSKDASIFISFDDGLLDNYLVAKQSLDKFKLKGVFFIPTNFIDNEGFMTTKMLKELKCEGHIIGGHGHNHINYLNSRRETVFTDMKLCLDTLRKKFLIKQPWLSYPYGAHNKKIDDICREIGFKKIFSSKFGSYEDVEALRVLPRIEVWNSDTPTTLKRKIIGKYDWLNKN